MTPAVAGLALLGFAAAANAAEPVHALREKQAIRTRQLEILRPAGIAYAPEADLFIVLPSPGATGPAAGRGVAMTKFQEHAGSVDLAGLRNPRAVAWDAAHHRLLVLDVAARAIRAIPGDASGTLEAARQVRLEAPRLGPIKPAGMTVDPASGEVFVLDGLMRRVLRFTPGEIADAAPPAAWIDLGALATLELSGLAFDPRSGHLFTLDVEHRTVHEITTAGRAVASYDASGIRLADPQAMVFAPSGDQTDDPAALSLFVADPGAASSRYGTVVEMAFVQAIASGPEVPTITASLVRTTPTSAYSPPSPDPSGVCYNSTTGQLIISDAEVEEMTIYAGKNVFETSLTGVLQRSWTTLPWDIEPTGTAYNPNTRQLYITNDDADKLWTINPGADQLFGTSDDTRSFWKTNTFGNGDPEGVTYDPAGNRLFIADGVNEEIYVYDAGPNGVFNGGGDDIVTHFDTRSANIVDPETAEWRASTNTVLVMSSTSNKLVKEFTTTGGVVSTIDLSFAPLRKPAGMALAPSTNNTGWSLFIVNRGTDNDSDPRENDGTLVEVSIGGTVPNQNTAPVVNAGPNQTITLPASANLDGTVTDDGLPSPPSLTTTWSKVSGPGTVTFVNANAVDTQASFGTSGSYVLQLTANDGQLSNSAQVTITVNPASQTNTAPVVNAGPDQTITMPGSANLDGTVTDDGLPQPPSLTTTWSKVSGPGTVTFVNANAVDTQASFSIDGVYVLRLTASDGALSSNDVVQITVNPSGPANTAPVVSAGPNQTITLPASAALDGTVTDDGLPTPPSLTTTWSKVSGPGTVTFANANAVDTQASFSLSGSYVLRLTANDGALSSSAQVTITVLAAPSTNDWRVAMGGDDAEEFASGSVYTNSSDLELVYDGSNQTVALRFQGVLIPKGAQIANAYIQFTTDEAQADSTVLLLQGVAVDNAQPFGTAKFSLSSLARGTQSATWQPVPWTTINEAGANQRTVNIGPIIQEIVGRNGWVSGNSLAIIITGIGHRTARAYESNPVLAPLLHVDLAAAAAAEAPR